MQLFITSLNSGSNGNCYYVGNEQEAVLIDAGISCRETERRMHRLGLSLRTVKAIFISHEHSDHMLGLPKLAQKYQLPVYITRPTADHSRVSLTGLALRDFQPYTPVQIGSLMVTGFPKYHDAADPHSFMVSGNGVNVGVFTDIGAVCEHVITHFKQCHAAFLEANYDEERLENGRYPIFLKRRVRNRHGPLSIQQVPTILPYHKPANMCHLLLAHMSKDNNCPQLTTALFTPHMGNTDLIIASRQAETPLYRIMTHLN